MKYFSPNTQQFSHKIIFITHKPTDTASPDANPQGNLTASAQETFIGKWPQQSLFQGHIILVFLKNKGNFVLE